MEAEGIAFQVASSSLTATVDGQEVQMPFTTLLQQVCLELMLFCTVSTLKRS